MGSDRSSGQRASSSAQPTADPEETAETRTVARSESQDAEAPAPWAPLDRGAAVGRFLVLDVLGRGGMGVVYQAHDPELNRQVALKLVRVTRSGSAGERSRARLLREAQALAQLTHPNVVTVYEVGSIEDGVFVAMEYVEGYTVRDWLRVQIRSPREILAVFAAAGRGLAAAHSAGLVHRDFKPANVMVGTDQRVRVLDFGLARAARADAGRDDSAGDDTDAAAGDDFGDAGIAADDEGETPSTPGAVGLATPLTRAGVVVGTPAYMAPEQRAGHAASARADQYSYCITLYEALFGQRPPDAPAQQPPRKPHRIMETRSAARLRARLRPVVMRGLSADPEKRYPTMEQLVAALESAGRQATRAGAAGVAIVAAAIIGVLGLRAWYAKASDTCKRAGAQIAEVWNEDRRVRAREAFLATGIDHAEATFTRVEKGLDEFAASWASLREHTCEAGRAADARSAELAVAQVRCLERLKDDFAARVDLLLGDVDRVFVSTAAQAVAALAPISACQDEDALLRRFPLPDRPETRARVRALERRLANVSALYDSGKYELSLERAQRVVPEAREVGFRPLLAEALYELARPQHETGAYAEAEATLHEALDVAAEARHDEVIAKAWVELVWVVGHDEARYDDALSIGQAAEVAVVRAGLPNLTARLWNYLGVVHNGRGEYALALELYERAVRMWKESCGPDCIQLAHAYNNIGISYYQQGDNARARDYYQRAVALWEKKLGPDVPDLAMALNNLGLVQFQQGEYEEASANFERVLAIRESALGPDHPRVAIVLNNLGQLYYHKGDYERARRYYERALAINEAALGPEHPDLAYALTNLGELHAQNKDYEKARASYERALAIWEKALGPAHPNVAYPLTGLGETLFASGQPSAALPLLERALAIREKNPGTKQELADTQLSLVRVRMALGADRAGSLELAIRARDNLRAAVAEGEPLQEEVAAAEALVRKLRGE